MSRTAETVSVYAISLAGQSLEPEIEQALAWMSPDEREKFGRFHFDRHRREFALSRFALRGVLAELAGCDPARLRFLRHPDGKPYLAGSAPSFNLTHTDDFVALVTGPPGARLGVDAEPLDRRFDADLLNSVFGGDERRRIAAAREEDSLAVTFWTAKEAYLKQIGAGLTIEPKRLSLMARPSGPGMWLDGRADPGCILHCATIGRHRLCAATETPEPPKLHLYREKTWQSDDRLWSAPSECGTALPAAPAGRQAD